MNQRGPKTRVLGIVAVLVMLAGCGSSPVPVRPGGVPMGGAGESAELVFDSPAMMALGPLEDTAFEDRRAWVMHERSPESVTEQDLWPEPSAPSLARSRRVFLNNTNANSVIFFQPRSTHDRSNQRHWR